MISRTGISRKTRNSKGFTLIELMLVAVLLLAIVSLSAPVFRRTFSDLAVKDASFSIAKLINYAQDRSILERKSFRIYFNFKDLSYQMVEKNTQAKEGESPYKKIAGRYGRVYRLPKGTLFNGTRPEIVFYPDGRCSAIGLELLVKGRGYVITTKGFGNLVEVKETKHEK